MADAPKGATGAPPRRPEIFPRWGTLAIPGGVLWGTALGALVGIVFGNVVIGTMIGAGLGLGIGLALFAAAVVVASGNCRHGQGNQLGRAHSRHGVWRCARRRVGVHVVGAVGWAVCRRQRDHVARVVAFAVFAGIGSAYGHDVVVALFFLASFFPIGALPLGSAHWSSGSGWGDLGLARRGRSDVGECAAAESRMASLS